MPWEVYLQYGDLRLLEEHYPAMAAYVDYLGTTLGENGLSSDNALGDWLGPQNDQLGSDFLVTAYHVYDLWIMAKTAELLHKGAFVSMMGGFRSMDELRAWAKEVRTALKSGVIAAGLDDPEKPQLFVTVSDDLVEQGIDGTVVAAAQLQYPAGPAVVIVG